MILKALYDYYQRYGALAPQGMEYKEIAFLIVIDREGRFVRIEDRRMDNKTCSKFLVIKGIRSGITPKPYIYWDNVEYVLNYTKLHQELSKEDCNNRELVEKRNDAIHKAQNKHDALISKYSLIAKQFPNNMQFKAVSQFFNSGELAKVYIDPLWSAIAKKPTVNLSFILDGELSIVAEHEDLYELIEKEDTDSNHSHLNKSTCMVTGKISTIVESTTPTSIPGSQATARLVAFQVNSGYDSYGKSKGFNASISKEAEACYTTALNKLLEKGSRNRFYIGSRTFVFWASSNNQALQEVEESISTLFSFNAEQEDSPNKGIEQVEKILRSIFSGVTKTCTNDKFYFLGLAPNSARIAVVYWAEISIKKFAALLIQHFDDFEIADTREKKRPYKGVYQILSAVSLKGEISNCQPNLPESVIKSMLQGLPYSYSLYSAAISRIRAKQNITITSAAIIKAYLNRLNDINNKKITITMDKENKNPGYLCGRLFATLEYLQEKTGASTIRSRYICAASSTPASIFATLLNLSVHHSEKLDKGAQIFFENIKAEIISAISSEGFPAHLDIQDQGRFMVGYYHQRQLFYTSKDKNTNTIVKDNE